MKAEDYTIEYCPFCDTDQVIHSHGVTACPSCGASLAPCSVCSEEWGGCIVGSPCPYGCTGGPEDANKPITMPSLTAEEIAFALQHL